MKENYIKDLEQYKQMLEKDDPRINKQYHNDKYNKCCEVARNITTFDLETIYYLRLVDNDCIVVDFLKELYDIKLNLKNAVLKAFRLSSILEPFNYDKPGEEQ